MKTYALMRNGEKLNTVQAPDIDHALDIFFRDVQVDVDLDTATPHRIDVRPLRQRKSLAPFVIEEIDPDDLREQAHTDGIDQRWRLT
jgi:hypothetical protein